MLNTRKDDTVFELHASRQADRLLTGVIGAVESYTLAGKDEACGIVFYGDYKVIVPTSQMGINKMPEDMIERGESEKKYYRKVIRSMFGAEIDFIVKGIDKEKKLAIATRKLAMEKRKKLELVKRKPGDIIKVRVTGIGRNYIYVEAYGIESTIAKEDIDYGYIYDIQKHVQMGDRVAAVIHELDIPTNHIKLSIKDTKEDPYVNIEDTYRPNQEYLGTITGVREFGIFVELRQGIYALCPHTNWTDFSPTRGDTVAIRVRRIDKKERTIDANLLRVVKSVLND